MEELALPVALDIKLPFREVRGAVKVGFEVMLQERFRCRLVSMWKEGFSEGGGGRGPRGRRDIEH